MGTLTLGDIELFFEEAGSGPPLVFLHGLGSSTKDWKAQLDHFSATHRCVAFDLPGSGRSVDRAHPHGPFTLEAYARAVADALGKLGLAPATVVGLSMGGMTALQLALDAPTLVRALVVVNAGASVVARTLGEKALLGLRAFLTRTLGPKAVGRLVAPRLFPEPGQAALRERFIAQLAAQDSRTYLAVSRAVMGWTVEDRVQKLACPTVFLASDGDYTPLSTKEALARRIPGAKVVVLPNSHHAVPLEHPEIFNRALEQTLAGFDSNARTNVDR